MMWKQNEVCFPYLGFSTKLHLLVPVRIVLFKNIYNQEIDPFISKIISCHSTLVARPRFQTRVILVIRHPRYIN